MNDEIKRVFINTGNLLSSESFKRKVTLLPSEEILEGLNLTLNELKANPANGLKPVKLSNDSLLISSHLSAKMTPEESQGSKIVVKIFTYSDNCAILKSAIDFVMEQLGVSVIDSLILSLPPDRVKASLDMMKPLWNCAVKQVKEGKVKEVGVSDLNTEQLVQLYSWAPEIKPTSNQINLEACCVIPPEMSAFAQDNEIRLLTHNDPRDFVTSDKLESFLSDFGVNDADKWHRLWVARYSVMVLTKGIIKIKGYIVAATKLS